MKRYHFIGIGGIGMSGLAQILLGQGDTVSGSDLRASEQTQAVTQAGGQVWIGHKTEQVHGADCVVYSSAIPPDNPELVEAEQLKILILRRAELLAELMQDRVGIAVAGAHGKTTTASMISVVLRGAGLHPTSVIGGVVINYGANAELGTGDLFIVETDESDGSFLSFAPTYAVITNIDDEHLDFFKTRQHLEEAFVQFANRVKSTGQIWLCADQWDLHQLARRVTPDVLWYGCSPRADVRAEQLKLLPGGSQWVVWAHGRRLGSIRLCVPGRHNITNALAAIGMGLELGVPFGQIAQALELFRGARRRMEVKLRKPIMVIDDYAHHPTEIQATMEAARLWPHKRLIVVFQPHRYTRTQLLKARFARILTRAPHLFLTDLYPASEPPIEGVSSETILDLVHKLGHRSAWLVAKEELVEALVAFAKPQDLILCMGAGDITKSTDRLAERLAEVWKGLLVK